MVILEFLFLVLISMFYGRVVWLLLNWMFCFRVSMFRFLFMLVIFRLDFMFLIWICLRVLVGVMVGIMF